ncbi:hypothetical protein OHB26_21025 [Nocardia sp. NBC_01503]|uniref:hypothetical protein n=1 Tax=Nocardia sp. NBC_01503 TaxID=2975997 RepID=UPI002E7C028F|nr:hypothetical protein [Nocardia sp. NBC_01503]WTL29483.1 hypothetical protein OHB26_21025 [Nocardia sp. NBC_01503]
MRNPYTGNCGNNEPHPDLGHSVGVGFSTEYDAELNVIVFGIHPDGDRGPDLIMGLPLEAAMAVHDLFDAAILDALDSQNNQEGL